MSGDADEPGRSRGLIAALVVVALVVAGGLWLSIRLHGANGIQDCVMAGRSNCAPVR